MNVRLIVQSGAVPAEFNLRLPAVLGRSPDADFKVKHHHVSRRHCELFEDGGQLIVRDLGSANGTVINGDVIDEACALSPGDELVLGGVTFRVEFESLPHAGSEMGSDAVQQPPQFEVRQERAVQISYAESDAGSFVGIPLGEHPAPWVDEEFRLELPEPIPEDISRIELHVDLPSEPPVDEDSDLDEFLRGIPDP